MLKITDSRTKSVEKEAEQIKKKVTETRPGFWDFSPPICFEVAVPVSSVALIVGGIANCLNYVKKLKTDEKTIPWVFITLLITVAVVSLFILYLQYQNRKIWKNAQKNITETEDIQQLMKALGLAIVDLPFELLFNEKWNFFDQWNDFLSLARIGETYNTVLKIQKKSKEFPDYFITGGKMNLYWYDKEGVKQSFDFHISDYKETNRGYDELVFTDEGIYFFKYDTSLVLRSMK